MLPALLVVVTVLGIVLLLYTVLFSIALMSTVDQVSNTVQLLGAALALTVVTNVAMNNAKTNKIFDKVLFIVFPNIIFLQLNYNKSGFYGQPI